MIILTLGSLYVIKKKKTGMREKQSRVTNIYILILSSGFPVCP